MLIIALFTTCYTYAQDSQEFAGKAHNEVERGDFTKAIELYTRAIELENDFYLFYFNRASCYLKVNEPLLALADLNTSIALDSNRIPTRFQRGIVLAQLKNYEAAIADMSVVITSDSTNSEALLVGKAYLVRGRLHLDFDSNTSAACADLHQAFDAGEKSASQYFPEECK